MGSGFNSNRLEAGSGSFFLGEVVKNMTAQAKTTTMDVVAGRMSLARFFSLFHPCFSLPTP